MSHNHESNTFDDAEHKYRQLILEAFERHRRAYLAEVEPYVKALADICRAKPSIIFLDQVDIGLDTNCEKV